ncbi:hypothetical protein ACET3Z_010086 [Daucus carota]
MSAKLSIQMMMLVMLLFFTNQAFAKNTKNSVAKPGCQASCGNLNISYPFGIGEKCSASKAMVISCNNSFSPPKAFLRDQNFNSLEVLNISLEAGTVHINFPVTADCTNTGNDQVSQEVRLELPLTFSNNDNRFTAMGCNNLAYLSAEDSVAEHGGCLSRCNPSVKKDNSCFGINCCQTKFQQSLTFVKPSLSNGSSSASGCNEGPRYAFIADQKWFAKLEDIYSVQTMEKVPAVLNWKPFGTCQTFIQSDPIPNATLCGRNAFCTNQSLCSCSEGYEGNPYLPNGCQDVNECGTNIRPQPRQTPMTPLSKGTPKKLYMYHVTNSPPESQGPALRGNSLGLNKCEHYCTNTPGSYTCSCQDGWVLVDKFNCVKSEVIYNNVPKGGRRGRKGAVLVTAGTCAGVGVVLVFTYYLYEEARQRSIRRFRLRLFRLNGGPLLRRSSSGQENAGTTELFTAEEMETATDHYNEDRIVGERGKRTVYKGMLADGRIVAVKKTKIEDKSKIEDFINEVAALSRMKHRNVVNLYGCCLETEVPLLVYEFIPNRTLMQYIHEDDEYFLLTWDVRVRVAIEIAEALVCLHSAVPTPIYHRDIKSTNILFDDKYRAKVADFGISASFFIDQEVEDSGTSATVSNDQKVADFGTSTSISSDQKVADFGTSTSISNDQKVVDVGISTTVSNDQTYLTSRLQGRFGYLDPEYFQSGRFTDKSDVYSFGVVLVELLTGRKPILAARLDDEARGLATLFILAVEEDRIFEIVDSRIFNEERKEEMIAFGDIAYKCLNLNGRKRPTMKEVAEELKSIRDTRESPIAQEIYEEVENEINELINSGSEVTSSSLSSTIFTVVENLL